MGGGAGAPFTSFLFFFTERSARRLACSPRSMFFHPFFFVREFCSERCCHNCLSDGHRDESFLLLLEICDGRRAPYLALNYFLRDFLQQAPAALIVFVNNP